jgi:hypothetical protein
MQAPTAEHRRATPAASNGLITYACWVCCQESHQRFSRSFRDKEPQRSDGDVRLDEKLLHLPTAPMKWQVLVAMQCPSPGPINSARKHKEGRE